MYSSDANTITTALAQIWRLFYETPLPYFGLHVVDLLIGVFLVRFVIRVIKFVFVPDMEGSKDKGSEGQNE